ncbi:hypothetical protein [Hymenobacter sp.]|uniref:hypothetical protein n=1 Tax=Hymenobacter sp. TaxID=1898978 RepID=UPI00286B107F|nr:hypothetical protein [Hymenobacter sp.]
MNVQFLTASRADFPAAVVAAQVPEMGALYARYQNNDANLLADGSGNITTWLDSSGRSKHLTPPRSGTQKKIVVDNRPYHRFNDSGFDVLQAPDAFPVSSDYSLLFRWQQLVKIDKQSPVSAAGQHAVAMRAAGNSPALWGNTGYLAEAPSNPPAGGFYTLFVTYDNATGTARTYINNVLGATQGGGSANTAGTLVLGDFLSGFFGCPQALLGELVVYNTVVAAATRDYWHSNLT